MPNLQTLPFDIFILGLRIAFIGLIYLFLFQVMRVIARDLRQTGTVDASHVKSRYGRLVVVEPGHSHEVPGTIYTLQSVTSIGRKPSNTVEIDSDFISLEHALVSWRDGRPWLEDVGSTNGTRLNGAQIVPGRSVELSEGDLIDLGNDVQLKWTES